MSARLAQILTTALLAAHLLLAPASHAAPDIVNGSPTQAWPTVARLVIEGGAPRVCSAVFIGCQTALTAAHCVCDGTGTGDACPGGDDQFVEAPENLYLYLQHGGLYFVRGISVPANYEFGVASDVAVLDLSDSLRGIAPSPINTRNRPSVPQSAQIVGFGSDFNMAGSGIKSEGVITTESCESSSTMRSPASSRTPSCASSCSRSWSWAGGRRASNWPAPSVR